MSLIALWFIVALTNQSQQPKQLGQLIVPLTHQGILDDKSQRMPADIDSGATCSSRCRCSGRVERRARRSLAS